MRAHWNQTHIICITQQSSSSTQFSQEWVVKLQKGGRKTLNKWLKDMNKTKTFLFVDCPWHDVDNCHYLCRLFMYTCSLHSTPYEAIWVSAHENHTCACIDLYIIRLHTLIDIDLGIYMYQDIIYLLTYLITMQWCMIIIQFYSFYLQNYIL